MPPTDFQASPYEPIRSYDAPGVLLTQLFDNEVTWRSIVQTMQGGEGLSPRQRDSFTQRVKERVGRNPFTDAIVDVVTNPFVWAAFLISPAGATALQQGGRIFGASGKAFNAWLKEDFGFMQWGMSAYRRMAGTPGAEVLAQANRHMIEVQREAADIIEPALQDAIRGLRERGVKVSPGAGLNPNDPRNWRSKDWLGELGRALHLSLAGADRTQRLGRNLRIGPQFRRTLVDEGGIQIVETLDPATEEGLKVYKKLHQQWVQKGELRGGILNFKGQRWDVLATPRDRILVDFGPVTQQAWTATEGAADAWLQREGVWGLREAYQKAMQLRFFRMWGKDGVADELAAAIKRGDEVTRARLTAKENLRELMDPEKVLKVGRHMRDAHLVGTIPADDFSMMNMLLGKDTRAAFFPDRPRLAPDDPERELIERLEKMTDEKLLKLAGDAFEARVNLGAYMPRNMVSWGQLDEATGRVVESAFPVPAGDQRSRLTAPGPAYMRTAEETAWFPEDLEAIDRQFGGSDFLKRLARESEAQAWRAKKITNESVAFNRVQFHDGMQRYLRGTARSYAWHVREPSEQVLRIQRESLEELNKRVDERPPLDPRQIWQKRPGVRFVDKGKRAHGLNEPIDSIKPEHRPYGGFSLAEALGGTLDIMPVAKEGGTNPNARFIREAVIAAVNGETRFPNRIMQLGVKQAQAIAHNLVETPLMAGVRARAPGFMEWLKAFSEADTDAIGRAVTTKGTKYLYQTHLGFNPASAMLNLTQPWLLAASVLGGGNVAAAYPEAIRDLWGYAKARHEFSRRMGRVRISDEERLQLAKKHIRFFEESGLSGDALREADAMLLAEAPTEVPSWGKFLLDDVGMALFQKAEWLNRLVTAHAVSRLHRSRFGTQVQFGTTADNIVNRGETGVQNLLSDLEQAVAETQFGASALNTPGIFLPGSADFGGISGIFSNPVMRQFQTFVVRSFVNPFVLPRALAGTERYVGLAKFGMPGVGFTVRNPGAAVALDFMRAMGYSAVMYEVAKNVLQADFSRAGFAAVTFEAFGGDNLRSAEGWSPQALNPFRAPAVSLAYDTFRGVLFPHEDRLLTRSLARITPGGIGLSRVLSVFPEDAGVPVLGDLAGLYQRRYADWENPAPDGSIPVFKGDGSLVEYRKGWQLVLEGLGVDLGAHRRGADFDHYMTTVRDDIVQARHKMINAIFSNDVAKAQRIRAEFQRKYGFPLTVSREQLRAFFRRRNVPRSERILDRLPREIRPEMAEMLARTRPEAVGLRPETIVGSATARGREALQQRPSNVPGPASLDPETIAMLREVAQREQAPIEDRSYQGFRSY